MSLFVHFVLPKGAKKLIWYQKNGLTLKFRMDKVKNGLMCHLDTQNSLEPLQILGCGNIF
jgi:hypothetical protein